MNPLLSPIVERAAAAPDLIYRIMFAEGEWRPLSYRRLMGRAAAFHRAFVDHRVNPGAVVFLVLQHGLDEHAAFLGAMLGSAVPSLLPYPNVKQSHADYWAQHRKIFEFVRPAAIVAYEEIADQLRACVSDLGIPVISAGAVEETSAATLPQMPAPQTVALLQHSSGTTGLKKGVALSYEAIVAQLIAYRDVIGLAGLAEPVFATWLPPYHDMGLITSFLLPLWQGAPIVSIDPFDWVTSPGLLLDAVERFRATHAWLPNFAFIHMARRVRRDGSWDLRSLRALINCSEPCKPAAFDAFLDRFSRCGIRPEMLQTCYAMAETVFAVSQSRLGQTARRLTLDRNALGARGAVEQSAQTAEDASLLSNGRPIAGCEVRILANDVFVEPGRIGEICVRADYMFSGYYRNAEATRAAFHGEWYKTGDLGFIHDGEIFVIGRLKDVIIVNGKNLFAHDIEAAVSRVPDVIPGRAVAFGRYSAATGSEELIVVAECSSPDRQSGPIAIAINKTVLAEVGVACADIRVVDPGWLVKTTSGKVSRSDNAQKYEAAWRSVPAALTA